MHSNNNRLSKNPVPRNYDLRIQVDIKTEVFTGYVCINLENKRQTDIISLNSVDLVFDEQDVFYEYEQGSTVNCKTLKFQPEYEKVVISFTESIQIGLGKLHIKYKGTLREDYVGFYRVKYNFPVKKGRPKYTGVTQFEACDARKAFPCWDEPAFKATFEITLTTLSSAVVLSNMPCKEIRNSNGDSTLAEHVFERTPAMSTYLVAFVIGDYDRLHEDSYNDTVINVYTPVDNQNLGEFALDIAKKSLQYFTEFFQIDYPLPKLDLIAVPVNLSEVLCCSFNIINFSHTSDLQY
jgi:puromycin-sensitive aminopeptidase